MLSLPRISKHARRRVAQRRIPAAAIALTLTYGRQVPAGRGCVLVYMDCTSIRDASSDFEWEAAEARGLQVIYDPAGQVVVTAFRARRRRLARFARTRRRDSLRRHRY